MTNHLDLAVEAFRAAHTFAMGFYEQEAWFVLLKQTNPGRDVIRGMARDRLRITRAVAEWTAQAHYHARLANEERAA